MFFASLLVASAMALAVWTDLRLGRAAPSAGRTVVLHLGSGALAVMLAPQLMVALGESTPLALVGVLGVFLPALVYLFVGSIWTFKLIQRTIVR